MAVSASASDDLRRMHTNAGLVWSALLLYLLCWSVCSKKQQAGLGSWQGRQQDRATLFNAFAFLLGQWRRQNWRLLTMS